jgi:hypothetical protein
MQNVPSEGLPDVTDLLTWVQNWYTQQRFKILQIYQQKGGWEGWAQVELANGLSTLADCTCQREIMVYANNQKRADLLLTSKISTDPRQVMELKCESLFQDAQGNGAYVDKVIEDLDKITDHPVKQELRPARVIALGATFVDKVTEYAAENKCANWGKYAPYIQHAQLATDIGNTWGLWCWFLLGQWTVAGDIIWVPREGSLEGPLFE